MTVQQPNPGCHCPATPGGEYRPGIAPLVPHRDGEARLCPRKIVRVSRRIITGSDRPQDDETYMEFMDGVYEISTETPEELIARFQRHGCPGYALIKFQKALPKPAATPAATP